MGSAFNIFNTSPKGTLCHFLFFILFFADGLSSSHFSQDGSLSNNTFTPAEIWKSGLPSIENYTSGNYQSSPQNWGFTEGSHGIYTLQIPMECFNTMVQHGPPSLCLIKV